MSFKDLDFDALTEQQFDDLLACAFEGGSNYWYFIESFENKRDEKSGLYYVNRLPTVSDREGSPNDMCVPKKLTIEVLHETMKTLKELRPKNYENIVEDNYDAEDADVFLQYAVLGCLIYG